MYTSTPHKPSRQLVLTGVIALGCMLLLFGALAANVHTKPFMPPKVAQEYMEQWLIESSRQVAGEVRLKHVHATEPFYLHRDYQPIWMNNYELTSAGIQLLQILRETAADNWRNYGYELATLERETLRLSNIPKQATAVEVLLTDAFITYAKQALNAQLLPDVNEADHQNMRKVSDIQQNLVTEQQIVDLLNDAIKRNDLGKLLDQLTPSQPGYLRLRNELNRYLALADSGHWQSLPKHLRLQEQDRHPMVPYLRWLFEQTGDLPKESFAWLRKSNSHTHYADVEVKNPDLDDNRYLFDANLKQAVENFQTRHRIEPSGEIDQATLIWLNVPPHQLAQKIALNMKRWRHLPNDLGQRYVMINMADYKLELINNGAVELDMKVIIGNQQRRTPVMSHKLSTLELAPTWSVPKRIALASLVPRARRDPGYLERKGFQVIGTVNGVEQYLSPYEVNWHKISDRYFPFRIVQKAGADNALGSIKFLFPNDQDIYLHDTSQPQLFGLENRAISSGCVRVEHPRLLADKLLRGQQGWNRSAIDSTIKQNRTTRIRLQDQVPIYLMYWTTWVDHQGRLQIRDDVYQRDLVAGLPPINPAIHL